MTNFINRLSLLIVCALFWACKPQLQTTTAQHNFKGQYAPIPYTIYKLDKPVTKTLLYLPPALDSLSVKQLPVFEKLLKAGYEIVEITAPKEGEFYLLREMNFASQRASEIISTARYLKSSSKAQFNNLVVLGVEEGAYLAPTVAVQLKADSVIYVNGGPFSPLLELEKLTEKDSLNPAERSFIQEYLKLDSLPQLELAIRRVKRTDPNNIILGMQTNKYWLSFNQEPLSEVYTHLPGANFWILFEDYPLNRASNLNYLQLLNKMQGNAHNRVLSLKGDGKMQGKNLERLNQELEKVLTP